MIKTNHLRCFFWLTLLMGLGANAQTQPPNTLSIITYGASTNSADNATSIQNCINAAQSQGKGVWIPAGIFTNTGSLHATGILIAGAGMTNSIIYRQQNSTDITATELSLLSCSVQDLGIDGNGTSRGVNASYGINMKGVGWLVQRVQVHHSDAGMWLSGMNGTAQDCNLLQTFADGININNAGADANRAGANLTIQNCFQDGAGDDGFAINSQGNDVGWTNMLNPKVVNCTSINAFYANGIRMAGGQNSLVQSCMVSNTTRLCGIETSSFGSGGFGITNGLITGNWVYGSGTVDESSTMKTGDARTVATYSYNTLINSSHYGFQIGTPTYPNAGNIVFGPSNVIINPTLSGIHVQSGVVGSGLIITNTLINLPTGQSPFVNGSSTFTATLMGNSWQGLPNAITTSAVEGSGTNWLGPNFWSSSAPPSAGNFYEALSGAILRPPTTASSSGSPIVFPGDALQIDSGANIRLKSSSAPASAPGFFTFSGIGSALILNGGFLASGDDFTATINSPINVIANSAVYCGVDATTANDLVNGARKGFRNYIFNGSLSGSGNLAFGNAVMYNNPAVTVSVGTAPNFAFNASSAGYVGNIIVTAGWLQAGAQGALGTGNITIAGGNASNGVNGPAQFDATVAYSNLTATLTIQNTNSFLLLDTNMTFGSVVIDGVTLTNGNTYTAAQINSITHQTNVIDATGVYTLKVGTIPPPPGSLGDTNIQYFGRWVFTNSSQYVSYWGGAYFKVNFSGTTVSMTVNHSSCYYAKIDGSSWVTYSNVNGTINLTSTPLASGIHTLSVAQGKDYDYVFSFQGLTLDAGATTGLPTVSSNLIEFIGDSITAGYTCAQSEVSDYAWVCSENLGVEHTQIAYPGVDLVTTTNHGTGQDVQYFKTQNFNYPSSPDWGFTNYTARCVVINLGQNDIGANGIDLTVFQNGYMNFMANIRAKYPNADIFAMRTFAGLGATQTQAAVAARNAAGDSKVHYIDTTGWLGSYPGPDWDDGVHPSVAGHIKAANALQPILSPYVGGPLPPITTSAVEGSGTNWLGPNFWSSGQTPSAGNFYEALSGAVLRPPQTGSTAGSPIVFAGDALQIDLGANIRLKSSGAPTAGFFTFSGLGSALILNGGFLANGDDFAATINSPLNLIANSAIYAGIDATTANDQSVNASRRGFRNYIFNGGLTGIGNLTLGNAIMYNNPLVTVSVGVTPNFVFTNGNSGGYSGNITVTAGWLQAGAQGALGTGNLTIAGGNASNGVNGPALFDATVAFSNLTAMLTIQNTNSFLLLDTNLTFKAAVIGGITFTNGVYTAAQINARTGQTNVVDATGHNVLNLGGVAITPVLYPQLTGSKLVLGWTNAGAVMLQSATNVLGPWTPVAGAASPYTNDILPQVPTMFFKLQ